jgi:hypothetical protein
VRAANTPSFDRRTFPDESSRQMANPHEPRRVRAIPRASGGGARRRLAIAESQTGCNIVSLFVFSSSLKVERDLCQVRIDL